MGTNADDKEWCDKVLSGMYNYLKDKGYLCGFIRFHPVLENYRLMEGISISDGHGMRVLFDRRTVSIDTSADIGDIWQNQISSKNRNMIRKAEKNGLVYDSEYDFKSMDDFIRLYLYTMERIGADSFYFFDRRYFNSIKNKLQGNAFLGTVQKNGKLICSAIFLYSECYGHYHLEGSDRDCAGFGANNYLLWKAACEMHELGIKEFHIGGYNGTAGRLPAQVQESI